MFIELCNLFIKWLKLNHRLLLLQKVVLTFSELYQLFKGGFKWFNTFILFVVTFFFNRIVLFMPVNC